MAEKPDKSNPYRISDAEMHFLSVPKPEKKAQVQVSLDVRTVRTSFSRVVILCILPLIPCGLLLQSARHYHRIIAKGDPVMRYGVSGVCVLFALMLVLSALYIYQKYSRKTITLETKRLVMRDADSLLAGGWHEVVVDPIKGSTVKTCVVYVAGRPQWIDSVFFPDFTWLVGAIRERAKAANQAINNTTVSI